ncbi:potassium channel family protein [Cytobacillus sp. Hm23]
MKVGGLLASYLRWHVVYRILSIIIIMIILFGTIIHLLEPNQFPTIFDGIWWAIITTSTVGYGDFVPASTIGRLVAIILILAGTGFVTTYFVTLAATAVAKENEFMEGKISFKGEHQIIIIGWNGRAYETITHLSKLKPAIEIILIDESLEHNPLPNKNVHFIKGNPSQDHTLKKANVNSAIMALITADQSKDELTADMNSILTLLAIKGLNCNIYSIVEILTSHHVNNAERAGADEIVQTTKLSSYVMVNSLLSHGMAHTLLKMLDHLKGSKIMYIQTTTDLINQTFRDVSHSLLCKRILLIGVKRGDESYVNPSHSFLIKAQDELLVIMD